MNILEKLFDIPQQERAVSALERIATALERLSPPPLPPDAPPSKSVLIDISDEDQWLREQEPETELELTEAQETQRLKSLSVSSSQEKSAPE